MATKLRLIAMKFFLSMGSDALALQGIIPIDGFIGDDWRKPTHLVIKIKGVSWLIPMSDLKEEISPSEGDGEASAIWFIYQGNDQLFRQAVSDDLKDLLEGYGCYYLGEPMRDSDGSIKTQRL